ncbi:copper amine oxidase N-terminal domain-containing protein [Cellulosilyticum sp. I15G10I2]|uniref:copper amine oxidase N-terminal domain-containing protein n=1 Tax=Cellulosilyticum sp. I15G10I2 TaxID=1892843 RepID=UPI00085C2695|nr:copper amine oxidase N-terminal domain-containing protein [Cellulosilyticum sp. I15G10I2]
MMNWYKGIVLRLLLLSVLLFIPNDVMAQSDNTLTKNTIIEEKGYRFSMEDANQLKIQLNDPVTYKGDPLFFYVNLEGAKWLESMNISVPPSYFTAATFKKISDTKLEVRIGNSIGRSTYYIPLLTELTGGEAKVSIDGGATEISNMPLTVFAVTSDQKAVVSAGDMTAVREEGTTANIRIDEIIKGSLTESARAENRIITLTLLNPNYEFENDKPVVTPGRAYYDMLGISTNYVSVGNKSDKSVIRIQLPQRSDIKTQGSLNISQIKVKAKSKQLQLGKVQIQVSGPEIQDTIITVAEILDYSINVSNRLTAPSQIRVGSKNNISFSIKEQVLDSMIPGKTVEVVLSKGYFSPRANASITDLKVESIKLNNQDITSQVPVNAIQKEGFLIGFSFDVPKGIDTTKLNEIQFNNVLVYAPNGTEGEVKIRANIAGIMDAASASVAVIKPLSAVNIEPIRLKAGVKDQVGGRIIITETDKDMIQAGIIELEIEKESGISFPKEPIVTVITGDIKLGDVRYDGVNPNVLKIDVLRTSRNASSIEIKNFVVTADGTVPDGGYKLTIKGSAIAPDIASGALEYNNFMIIGAVQIDVVPTAPVQKIISQFIIGSEAYDVNGEKRNMDAKAYLEGGRTMVPLRYVADAIGITSRDIKFASSTVTLLIPGQTIVLYDGESIAKVNDKELLINGKVIVKEGRTYVPVAEVARLLGIKVTWIPETKTAIFEK